MSNNQVQADIECRREEIASKGLEDLNYSTFEQVETSNHECTNSAPTSDLLNLEKRQEHLLQQLENLTTKLQQIKQQITLVPPVAATDVCLNVKSATSSMDHLKSFSDVVVTVSPSHQPIGLLVLTKWLQERFKVLTLCHVHSSLDSLPKSKGSLFGSGPNKEYRRGQQQLLITTIWKDVGADPWLIIAPTKQSAISGEINIIRYLSSLIAPSYNFEDPIAQTSVDAWLDLAHHSVTHGKNKERQGVLRTLNSHLGKNPFLVGGALSIADVGMLSAVLQTEDVSDLAANIKRWLKSCSQNQGILESLDAFSIKLV